MDGDSAMGFVLSVLYLVTNYLTPRVIFGPLAAFRVELVLAAIITLISIPRLLRSFVLKTPQSLALIGLAIAVFASVLIGAHWAGGSIQAFLGFIPSAFAYFIVCLHFKSKKKLQALVAALLFVCLFVLARGGVALLNGSAQVDAASGRMAGGGYLLAMTNDSGEWIYRLRGLGEINDPNDFGQLIVCVIPLVFIFWRPKKTVSNIVLVFLPVAALLLAVFLTHSRGALLALLAVCIVAARRRIGTVPALVLAGGMFVALMAIQFTGGRAISTTAGEDRTSLWGGSLQLFKSHPLFGVGFGNLPDYLGQTAHNSVAVCAAELGLFGLLFWSLFLFPTLRDALAVASPENLSAGHPVIAEPQLYPMAVQQVEVFDEAEANRLGRLVLLSLVSFLVSGWFLSRAFAMTLFLLGGMAEVAYELSFERGMIARRLRMERVIPYSAGLAIALLLVLYVMLRAMNLTR